MLRVLGYVFAVVIMLLGLFFGWRAGVRGIERAEASKEWPQVDGTVIRSEVSSYQTRKRRTRYRAELEYRYEVDGESHTCDKLWVGSVPGSFDELSEATEILALYPVDAEVTVTYDPEDADDAMLLRGDASKAWRMLGVGAIFFVLGGVLILTFRYQARKERAAVAEGAE